MLNRCASAATLLVLAAVTPAAVIAQPDESAEDDRGRVALWVGHTASDNVLRRAGKGRGTYDSLGVLLNLARERNRLQAGLAADVEFRQYSTEGVEDERVGVVDAFADIDIVRERFFWSFRENLSQAQTDPFVAIGPQNRETISVFATGPRIELPLGRRTRLDLATTLSRRTYDVSKLLESDSVRHELGVYRNISPIATVGLVADRNEIEYDADLPGYDIETVRLHYNKQLASGTALAEVGHSELVFGDTELSGPLVRLAWDRSLTARSRLAISLNREFTDAGAELGLTGADLVLGPSNVILTSSPVEQERAEIQYDYSSPRTEVTAGFALISDDFESGAAFDNDGESFRLTLSRELTRRLRLGATWEMARREYADVDREDEDTTVSISLDRRLSRGLSVQGRLASYERGGTDSYDERRYEVRLVYEPGR